MRTPYLLVTALSLLCLAPKAASQPALSGRAYTEWYIGQPVRGVDSVFHLTLGQFGTQLYVRDVVNGRAGAVDGFVSFRGRQNLAGSSGLDPRWNLYQGYLQYRKDGRWIVRAGRLFLRGAVGARRADGVSAEMRLHDALRIDAFVSAWVDPLHPQRISSLDSNLWSGTRLRFRRGPWTVSPSLLFLKRAGKWQRQFIGLDAAWSGTSHRTEVRYYYNLFTRRTDEFRVAYSYRQGVAWRLTFAYQFREPRVSLLELSDVTDSTLVYNGRHAVSGYLTLALSRASTLSLFTYIMSAEQIYAFRYGATLQLRDLYATYERRDGHGSLYDRVVVGGRRTIVAPLQAGASVGLIQYRLSPQNLYLDQSATFAAANLVWTPWRRWSLTGEVQALGSDVVDYDVRLFSRLEYRIGGAS